MQIKITKRALLTAISRAAGVVERKSSMPILSNALLSADGDALSIAATDLYLGVLATAAAEVVTAGSVAISARTLHDLAKQLPDGDVSLKADANHGVEIRCGKVRFRVPGMPGADFPPLPSPADATWHVVPSPTLARLLAVTYYAASPDDTRPHLHGVMLAGDATALRAVATDGHRLSLATAPAVVPVNVLVPAKGVLELRRLCDATDGDLEIATDGRHLFARRVGVSLSVKLADESFPPYAKVIPQTHSRRALVAREALSDAIKRIAVVSPSTSGGVRLVLDAGSLRVASENPDVGEGSEEMAADYAGEPLTIGANAKYLLDALGSVADDDVALECGGDLDPIVVRPAAGTDFVGVVMPMRL